MPAAIFALIALGYEELDLVLQNGRTQAAVLGGDPGEYARKLRKKASFVYIARKVPVDRAARLDAMKIRGIGLLEDSKRTYPSGDLAGQVLGFVGIDASFVWHSYFAIEAPAGSFDRWKLLPGDVVEIKG